MKGYCYTCGKPGHYKDNCPKKNASVKCYCCNELGHYQETCPVKLEQERQQRAIKQEKLRLEQEAADKQWFIENIPDSPRSITNQEAIRAFLQQFPTKSVYYGVSFRLHTKDNSYSFYYANGRVTSADYSGDGALYRKIQFGNLDEFLRFLEQKGTVIKLSYKTKSTPEAMIDCLSSAGIATYNCLGKKHDQHSIGGQVVMVSRDERGWEHHIKNEDLIRKTYEAFLAHFTLEVHIHRKI